MSKTINNESPILVTGASGYIASWIVKKLLDQGHTVRGTVRDRTKTHKVQHLLDVAANSDGKLELFEADLLEKGSFAQAMEGCELVIHTASPFKVGKIKDPQEELVDPALNGTENVLDTVNLTSSVKRVVLTSSVVAIYGDAKEINETPNGVFTEEYWNESSSLEHQPYAYSKKVAEERAWEMAKQQNRWDLVVINPGFVMGPSLSKRKDGASTDFMMGLLDGSRKMGMPELYFSIVDVRDVAEAHIKAGLTPTASGRHITAHEKSLTPMDFAQIIQEKYGDRFPLPARQLPKFLLYIFGPLEGFSWKYVNKNVGVPLRFDNTRLKKDLKVNLRSEKETILDHVVQLVEDGLVKQ